MLDSGPIRCRLPFSPLFLIGRLCWSVSGGPIKQWEAAEEAIHQIVTHSDDEFSLTYDDLKKMLDWKDRLEELSVKCSTLVRETLRELNLHLNEF